MIQCFSFKLKSAVIAVSLSSLLLSQASAILIGFETGEGYLPGHLTGQPSVGTSWTSTGTAHNLVIEANAGTGGNDQALVAHKTETGTVGFYSFKPSESDLGAPFVPHASKVAFSFDYRFLGDYNGVYIGVAYLRIGTTSGEVLSFAFYSNGTVNYSDSLGATGQKNINAKASGGGLFYGAKNQWFQVDGVLDYATQTYTLSINGVAQASFNGERMNLGFNGNVTSTPVNSYDLNVLSLNVSHNDWRPYAMDNLSYAVVVPEPMALGWVAIGAVGMGLVYGRRRKST